MAYTRTTVIDATPSGDSVKQAVLDLDADLTGAFDGLNQIQAALALKINQSEYDQPSGVPRLDTLGKIQASQLPGTQADLPLGMIAAFGMETLPADSNWLECNGAELPIADYQALYGVVGNAFGLAASPSDFKLPDLRGTFLRGWDHGRGKDPDIASRIGGDHVGATQPDEFKSHVHKVTVWGDINATFASGTNNGVHCQTPGVPREFDLFPRYTGGSETRPVNTSVLYAIKWR